MHDGARSCVGERQTEYHAPAVAINIKPAGPPWEVQLEVNGPAPRFGISSAAFPGDWSVVA